MSKKILKLDNVTRLVDLASDLLDTGYTSQSTELFRIATDLRPTESTYWYNLARALREDKQFDAAIEAIDEALKLDDSEPQFFHAKGNIKRSLRDLPGAIAEFKHALALDNAFPAHNNLGLTLHEFGDLHEAKNVLEEGLRIFPDDTDLHLNLSAVYFNLGEIDDALLQDEYIARTSPFITSVWLNLANDYLLLERYRDALIAIERFKTLNGSTSASEDFMLRLNKAIPPGDDVAANS